MKPKTPNRQFFSPNVRFNIFTSIFRVEAISRFYNYFLMVSVYFAVIAVSIEILFKLR